MKEREKMRFLALAILVTLLSFAGICNGGKDELGCKTLVITCEGSENVIAEEASSLSQEEKNGILYFRFLDCTTGQWIQSSCSLDCKLELR
ncbi:MAG: hypothetical protein AMJ88_13675 [Anaerolineae bacterium SM23_ 63]|nr:MAG: hypothetical protein AMJ88_13675 [Anaerolineae bacterium SM23_ 63]